MNNDYSPSMSSLVLRWLGTVLVPVASVLLFSLDSQGLEAVLAGVSCGMIVSCGIVFESYYPVFLPDRILICNAMIPSICKEYRRSEIEWAGLRWVRRTGYVFYISPKGGERWIAYAMILKKDQIERIYRSLQADFPNAPAEKSPKDLLLTAFNMPHFKAMMACMLLGAACMFWMCSI